MFVLGLIIGIIIVIFVLIFIFALCKSASTYTNYTITKEEAKEDDKC